MQEFEGVHDNRLNRYVKKLTDEKGNPPENYKLPLRIPMDTAVALLRRFEAEPLSWTTGKEVSLQETICHLLWLWSKKLPIDPTGNIFEAYFPGQVKERKRRTKTPRKIKGYEGGTTGRKPKRHLVNLFESKNEPLRDAVEPPKEELNG